MLGEFEKNFLSHRAGIGGGNLYSKPGIKPPKVMCLHIVLPRLLTLSLSASFFLLPEFLGAVGMNQQRRTSPVDNPRLRILVNSYATQQLLVKGKITQQALHNNLTQQSTTNNQKTNATINHKTKNKKLTIRTRRETTCQVHVHLAIALRGNTIRSHSI